MRRLAVVGALSLGKSVWAQSPAGVPGGSPGAYLAQALLSLLLVIGLILALNVLLQRWSGRGGKVWRGGPAEVLQTLPLGGGRWVHLVRVGRRVLVLGAGTQGVRRLAELDASELAAEDEVRG